jgi:predicted ATPase/DNA-binding CsgD family transcriptional regulator
MPGREPPADKDPHHDLPPRPTPLIGRDGEIAAARQQLLADHVRLLTFVGPPGIGKTRLAVEVAAGVAAEFHDGVLFVDLTTVTDPSFVTQAIARSFGLSDTTREPTTARLRRYLHKKRTLVILDNFEHVIDAATDISELLGAGAGIHIIVTSREPLRLRWEHRFEVAPLGLPNRRDYGSADAILRSPAVRLFVERARATTQNFLLTDRNAGAVAEICVRLDGLPLAIELAAAKVSMFEPQEILERLEQRLILLTTGPRDAPARHQTLRDAIAWSYYLLTPREQALFRRLAVFAGSASLEAIQEVCDVAGDIGVDVLDALSALVDRHLVRKLAEKGDEPRFGLLESLREFGLEQLKAGGELTDVQKAHARFFLELAERAEPGLMTHYRGDRLEPDRHNLRAGVEWFLANGEAESALRLSGSAHWVWNSQGHFREIRDLLKMSLNAARTEPSKPRWNASRVAALGALLQGDLQAGAPLAAESLRLARILGKSDAIVLSLLVSGEIAEHGGELNTAIAYFEEALPLSRTLAYMTPLSRTLSTLGGTVYLRGDLPRATALLNEGLALALSLNNPYMTSFILAQLGMVALAEGRPEQAEVLLRDGLAHARQGNFPFIIIWLTVELSRALSARGEFVRAATLLGAAESLRERFAVVPVGWRRTSLDLAVTAARTGLGEGAFERAWTAGQAMSLAETIDYALEPAPRRADTSEPSRAPTSPKPSSILSGREREIATLVAGGHTNRTIGATLGITEKTVGAHVQNIMNKLGFHSRSQIAAWTAAHGSVRTP